MSVCLHEVFFGSLDELWGWNRSASPFTASERQPVHVHVEVNEPDQLTMCKCNTVCTLERRTGFLVVIAVSLDVIRSLNCKHWCRPLTVNLL